MVTCQQWSSTSVLGLAVTLVLLVYISSSPQLTSGPRERDAATILGENSSFDFYEQREASANATRHAKRVVLRIGGMSHEGLGSVLLHFKESVIFSMCVDSELLLPALHSKHKYSNSVLYNRRVNWMALPFQPPVCDVGPVLKKVGGLHRLISSCFGNGTTVLSWNAAARRTVGCGSFVHHVADKDRQRHEGLNQYIEPWVRQRLPPPRGEWRSSHLSVAIHLRWGDTASASGTPDPVRSISFENVTRVIERVVSCVSERRVHVKIFAEGIDEAYLRSRVPGPYDLVSAGDSWQNLADLASADVIVSGASSYAVVAEMMSDARLIVVANSTQPKFVGLSRKDKPIVSVDEFVSSSEFCTLIREAPSLRS